MILPADFTPTVRAFAPGRTELAGNHTDHQGGRVIAASTARGVQVLAAPNNIGRVRLESTGFPDFDIDVEDLAPHSDEVNTTAAIVRGMVAGCRAIGIQVQGFDARVTSTLPAGGGLSSSAACELALGCAMNTMFGTGEVPPLVMARLGFEVVSTGGTAKVLLASGVACRKVNKVSEGHPNIVDMITNGEVHLMVNTPFGHGPRGDGYQLRLAAVRHGVTYATTIAAAQALAAAMEVAREDGLDVVPLQDLS